MGLEDKSKLIEEIAELALHYPYPFHVCEYIYMAHGDKAAEILKVGVELQLSDFWIMELSDVCQNDTFELTKFDTLLHMGSHPSKEKKLPKKLRNGWS